MKLRKIISFSIVFVLSLFLAACSGGTNSTDSGNNKENNGNKEREEVKESEQKGGKISIALDAEFDGKLSWNFYESQMDAAIISLFDESLIDMDDELKPIPNIASWTTEDDKVYTFTFKQGVKWHNGEELTVNDWAFALETIAHPDYEGPRYVNVQNIVGVPEFNLGDSDVISGIKIINDYEIEITFDKARVNNLTNLWTYPMPKKAFEGVEVKDMVNSGLVRENPIGFGPFKVKQVVPGEHVELVKFKDYHGGEPKLDGIIVKVIDSSLTTGVLKSGDIDLMSIHPTYYNDVKEINGVKVEKVPGLAYYYIGFKLGHWDKEEEINIMDNEKYQDLRLRQAMYYAIDRESWVKAFFNGLGSTIERVVPNTHWIAADDSDLIAYEYNPEKAKELLDEAGYVDVDGDNYRENPQGETFVVKFAHYDTGNPTFEARSKAMMQYWEAVGLKSEFSTGNLIEVNEYYGMLESDDKEIEVYYGGWGYGAEPDPSGLWASYASWNYPRWVNEKNDQLLADAVDIDIVGTDLVKRKELYIEWQKLVNKELPMLPIMELNDAYAINEKLENVKINALGYDEVHNWSLK